MPVRVNTTHRLHTHPEDGAFLLLRTLTREDDDVVQTFVLRVPAEARRDPAAAAAMLNRAGGWVTWYPADGHASAAAGAGPAIVAQGVLLTRADGDPVTGTIHLAVAPAFRGRGLGRVILRELTHLARAAGVSDLTLALARQVRLPVHTMALILGEGRAGGERAQRSPAAADGNARERVSCPD